MNMKRIFALAFAVLMVLALAACGTKNNDKMDDMSGNGSAMTGEPKTAEEALTLHKELLERENAILSENTELWEKVFMEADKGMAMIEDGKNCPHPAFTNLWLVRVRSCRLMVFSIGIVCLFSKRAFYHNAYVKHQESVNFG